MNCEKSQRYIMLCQTGELPARKAGKLARHLEACEECRRYRDNLNAVTAVAKDSLPATEPGAPVIARILDEARKEMARTVFFPRPVLQWVAAAAAVIVCVCGAIMWSLNTRTYSTVSHVNAIVMVMGSEEDLDTLRQAGKLENDHELQTLAGHLLRMEGFVMEEAPDTEIVDVLAEPPPTALRSHSTGEPGAKICV